MYKRIEPTLGEEVSFTFNGNTLTARQGENLATALFLAGYQAFRTSTVSGIERGPFCMMGACYECMVEIDGETVQACMRSIENGMIVRRKRQARDE